MPGKTYEPLKLNQTNRYAGYQFHARVRVNGMDAESAFRYLVLSVYHWIRHRVPEEDRNAPELSLPEAEEYASVDPAAFLSYHFSIGYSLDITPLMNSGIWALRLKEPDIGTPERAPVSGRFFTTRVGLRLNEKGYTEMGIRIDVTDPASEVKELDYAFRPGFVRTLANQPSVVFEQFRVLPFGKSVYVNTEEDYKQLLYLLDRDDNQMPVVVFTHERPWEKDPWDELSKDDLQNTARMDAFFKQFDLMMMRDAMGVRSPVKEPVMPYAPDNFSRSAFAYALTYVLGDKYTERFASRMRAKFTPGDILLCEARKFRRGIRVFTSSGEKERQKTYDRAILAAMSYSKHKTPYSFGSVVFEAEARRMEQQARVMELVNSTSMADRDKIAQLKYETELLFNVIDDKNENIEELKLQNEEAFRRGISFRDNENAALEDENRKLRKELADKQNQIDQMLSDFQRARTVLDTIDQTRGIEHLPENNKDVVYYFKKVYMDRLVFTERGEAEASRCKLKPDHLWEILHTVANDMVDVFRNAQGNLTEEDIMKSTGFDVSFREGSMTREQKDYMRLRQDEYDGKSISVEPHLKLKSVKGEPAHQRLHFCYVPEMRKIVIGYLGDHLDSAATRYAGQR